MAGVAPVTNTTFEGPEYAELTIYNIANVRFNADFTVFISRKSTKFGRKLNITISYIFSLACPNRYEYLMFFDPLAISDII